MVGDFYHKANGKNSSGSHPKGKDPRGKKKNSGGRSRLNIFSKRVGPSRGSKPYGYRKFIRKLDIFFLETLYRIHIHIRYAHDKVYSRGGRYKKYSDSKYSQPVHKAGVYAFIISFVIFQFAQNVWPFLFTFQPREVRAGSATTTWSTYSHFNDANPQTGLDVNGVSLPNDADAGSVSLASNADTGDQTDGALTIFDQSTCEANSGTWTTSCSLTTFNISTHTNGNGGRTEADGIATNSTANTSAGASTIDVTDSTGFGDDDEVMIADTSSNSDGTFETIKLKASGAVAGNTLNFATGSTLTNGYDGTTKKISVIRIPQYTNVNINTSQTLTVNSWNSSTGVGGIMFFRAKNTVTVDGTINLKGLGYTANNGPGAGSNGNTVSKCNSGTYGLGGGGAGYGAPGGDGGMNATGATGGVSYGTTPGNSDFVGYMGSGGGNGGGSSSGGTGGGLLKVFSPTISISSSGKIQADGMGGSKGTGSGQSSKGGNGGGSGGGLYLVGTSISNSGILSAAGGGGGGAGYPQLCSYNGSSGNGGNGTSGNNGNGGNGGNSYSGGGSGAGATSSPGAGGATSGVDGLVGSGGGGGSDGNSSNGSGGGGGGAAGQIALYYGDYNSGGSRGADGYYGPTSTEVTGPHAYYIYSPPYNSTGDLGSTTGLRAGSADGINKAWNTIKWKTETSDINSYYTEILVRISDSFGTGSWRNPSTGTIDSWYKLTDTNYDADQNAEGSVTISSAAFADVTGTASETLEIKVRLTGGAETTYLHELKVDYDTLESPVLANMSISTASNGTISTNGTEGVYTKDTTVDFNVPTASLTCTSCGTSTNRRAQVEVRDTATGFSSSGSVGTDYIEDGGTGDLDSTVNGTIQLSSTPDGTFASGTGYHWRARSVDDEGRVSGWTSYGSGSDTPTAAADFTVDQTPPTLSSFDINGGAAATSSASVTLNISATDGESGMYQMRFKNDGAGWAAWEVYNSTKAWTLPAGDAVKKVYAQVRDAAGNISGTTSWNPTTWDGTSDGDYDSGGIVTANEGADIELGTSIGSSASWTAGSNAGSGTWTKKATVNITNFQSSYQSKVVVSYEGAMNSDFSDLRFYDETAATELPYWIESKTDGDTATVWFKSGSNNNISMYFGNPSATSSSDGSNTFIDFEDWSSFGADYDRFRTGDEVLYNGYYFRADNTPGVGAMATGVKVTGHKHGDSNQPYGYTQGWDWGGSGGIASIRRNVNYGIPVKVEVSSKSYQTDHVSRFYLGSTYVQLAQNSVNRFTLDHSSNVTNEDIKMWTQEGPTTEAQWNALWYWFAVRKRAATEPAVSLTVGYHSTGVYTSNVYDTTTANNDYATAEFTKTDNTGSVAVKVQAGTNGTPDNPDDDTDGTNWTKFYTIASSGDSLPAALDNKQYLRYKVVLNSSGDQLQSPLFSDIKLSWSDSASDTITLDSGSPDIDTLDAYTDSGKGTTITASTWQTDTDPYFEWVAPASGSGIDGYYYDIDNATPDVGGTWVEETTLVADYSVIGALSGGQYTFYVRAKNNAGQLGAVASFVVWVDNTDPVSAVTSPANSSLTNLVTQIDGTVTEANSGISNASQISLAIVRVEDGLYWDGVSAWTTETWFNPTTLGGTKPNYTWSRTTALPDDWANEIEKDYTIKVKTTDDGSNAESEKTITFSFDNLDPATPTVASTSHPTEGTWYAVNNASITTLSSTDTNGIDGYSYAWTQAGDNPDNTLNDTGDPATVPINYNSQADGLWHFKVKSQDLAGNWSAINDFTVRIDVTGPSGENIEVNGQDDTKIAVTWTPFTDPSSGLNEYKVYRSTAHGAEESTATTDPTPGTITEPRPAYGTLIATVNATTNAFTWGENLPAGQDVGDWNTTNTGKYTLVDQVYDSTPPQGGWYYYRIKATDNLSQTSSYAYGHSKTNSAPDAITDFNVNGGDTPVTITPSDSKTVSLTWTTTDPDHNPPGEVDIITVKYTVNKPAAEGGGEHATSTLTCPSVSCTAIANGFSANVNYTFGNTDNYGDYTIKATTLDTIGTGTHEVDSNIVTVKLTPDKPPGVSAATDRSTRIDINTSGSTWTAPNSGNGVASYNVYRRTDNPGGSDATWISGATMNNTSNLYYQDNTVSPSTTYYYRVAAVDQSTNIGLLSDAVSATPPAPGAPASATVVDASHTTIDFGGDFPLRFLVTWDELTTSTVPDLQGYKLERREQASGVWSGWSNIQNIDITAGGLSENRTYYLDVHPSTDQNKNYQYRVQTWDLADNVGSFVTTTSTAADRTQPNISNVQVTRKVTSATITYDTDEDTDTMVLYGTASNTFTKKAGDITTVSGTEQDSTSHSVTIKGLTPGTKYYFKVIARDAAGNSREATDGNFNIQSVGPLSSEFSFDTLSIDITDPQVSTTSSSATVSWTTNIATDSNVEFQKQNSVIPSKIEGSPDLVTSHSVTLTELSAGMYSYKVKSTDSEGNTAESALLTFEIPAFDTGTISTPQAGKIEEKDITATTAKITWSSTVQTTSWVDYGTTSGTYPWTTGNGTLTIDHIVTLEGLTPGTTYYYQVWGKDANGVEYRSQEYSFVALARPSITSIEVSSVGYYEATIRVQVTKDTTATVSYGKENFDFKAGGTGLAKIHEIKLENLEDNSTYKLFAEVKDASGNTATSDTVTFTTPLDTTGPEISELKIDILPMGADDETASAIISWTTNKPATTQVQYDEGIIGGTYSKKSIEDETLNTSHTVIVKELLPSTTYHMKLVSKDKRGNQTDSSDYTFVTPSKEKSILQLIIRSLEETFSWVREMPNFFRGIGNRLLGR